MHALFVAAGLAFAAPAPAEETAPGHFEAWIGKDAPAIVLANTDGKQVSLADYRGKLVVIHFGASW